MSIEERKIISNTIPQNIILENREKLTLSGVRDVLSFDDQIVIVETELGLLTIKGQNLKITKLSIDTGDVVVEGDILNLGYSEKTLDKKGTSIMNKLFRQKGDTLSNQAYIFGIFILNGFIIGILFDMFRSFRKILKTPDFITYIKAVKWLS